MDEKLKQAIMHDEAMKNRASPQQTGSVASAVDDIRHKLVEEPYFLRPEGREVTDDIEPAAHEPEAQAEPEFTPDEVKQSLADFYGVDVAQFSDDKGKQQETSQEHAPELGR